MGLDNPVHIAFLLILLLLVFGAKRLPEIGRSLGTGMRGFKESLSGDGLQAALTSQPAPAETPASTVAAPAVASVAPAPVPAASQPQQPSAA